jgi:ketosteroid isomerase-like protein
MACVWPRAYDSRMTVAPDPSPASLGAIAAIRAVRATSNQAIGARDADRVVACMMSDVTVAVAHGPQLTGRESSRAAFAAQFSERTFVGYVREPSDIAIHEPPTRATERGRWLGRWKQGAGEHVMRGTYVAEWCHTALGWFIQSEVFTPGHEAD